jgi:hypothetical protein
MKTNTLAPELLRKMDDYWRAANYLSVGQIYLYDNPLLKRACGPKIKGDRIGQPEQHSRRRIIQSSDVLHAPLTSFWPRVRGVLFSLRRAGNQLSRSLAEIAINWRHAVAA